MQNVWNKGYELLRQLKKTTITYEELEEQLLDWGQKFQ